MAQYKGAASEAGRALQIQKKREKAKEDLELRKRKIEEEMKLSSIDTKFAAHYDAIEAQLKSSTIGLVSLTEMKAKQEDFVKEREKRLAQKNEQLKLKQIEEKREERERQKRQIQTLSFKFDEDDENDDENDDKNPDQNTDKNTDEGDADADSNRPEDQDKVSSCLRASEIHSDENSSQDIHSPREPDIGSEDSNSCPSSIRKKRKMMKNPEVDTSFLPDKDREEEEKRLREELRQEWVQKQERLKNEDIQVTFSFWDGSGHRRSVIMKKGNSIYQFLQKCLELLRKEFHELRTVTADQLMYVKEDLIIPHHYTFYDFIITKARGKSGPLFSFDVHEDIRLVNDASVEKDESHAGKVLMRGWYERNKHIFPASRWEPYDPSKNYDKYTISDSKK